MESSDILRFAISAFIAVAGTMAIYLRKIMSGEIRKQGEIDYEKAKAAGRFTTGYLIKTRCVQGHFEPNRPHRLNVTQWYGTYAYEVNGVTYKCTLVSEEYYPEETIEVCYMPGAPNKLVKRYKVGARFGFISCIPMFLAIAIYFLLGTIM